MAHDLVCKKRKTVRATGFLKSASNCCQFVCIEHRVSIKFESSLMGFLCINAELFNLKYD